MQSEESINPVQYFRRSPCPITNVLDIVGDKWTLLIVRDIFIGKKRYGEFINSPEHIPSNILADRLKRLQLANIITKRAYQQKPKRYEYILTDKGIGLLPVLCEISCWAEKYIPGVLHFGDVTDNDCQESLT